MHRLFPLVGCSVIYVEMDVFVSYLFISSSSGLMHTAYQAAALLQSCLARTGIYFYPFPWEKIILQQKFK